MLHKRPALRIMAVACAASMMLALYAGLRLALSVLPPMMVLCSILMFSRPLVSVRGVVFITAVFQVCLSLVHISSNSKGSGATRLGLEER